MAPLPMDDSEGDRGRPGAVSKGREKMLMKKVLVTGAGGFIGHHLTAYLVERGYWVRGVDIKYPQFAKTAAHEFAILDLRCWKNCLLATRGIDEVYALAADMGGMGFTAAHHAQLLH